MAVRCGCGSTAWRARYAVPLVMHIEGRLRSVEILSPSGVSIDPVVSCALCGSMFDRDESITGPQASTPGQREAMTQVRRDARASRDRVPALKLRPSSKGSVTPRIARPVAPDRPDGVLSGGIVQLVRQPDRGPASLERMGIGVVTGVEPLRWPSFLVRLRTDSPDQGPLWIFATIDGGSDLLRLAQEAARTQATVTWSATWERLPWEDPNEPATERGHQDEVIRLTSLSFASDCDINDVPQ